MKSTRFVNILVGFALPLLFASCQDHIVPPGAKRFRIISTSSRTTLRSGGSFSSSFRYDANNRLVSYSYNSMVLFVNNPSGTTTLQYDAQGRLVSSEARYHDTFDPITFIIVKGTVFERTTYSYDAAGRLALVQPAYDYKNTGTFLAGSPTTYEYGAGKAPTKTTTTSTSSTLVRQYTYSNENVVRIDETTSSTTGAPVTITTTYGPYDNSPNPLYGLILTTPPPVEFTPYDTFSKNNPIGRRDTTYDYDANGLLVERRYGTSQGTSYFLHESFSYESY